jgi:hypothetical protein
VSDAGRRGVAPRAVRRDRTTWLAYVQVGLFGYFLYAFGPSSRSRAIEGPNA